VWGEGDGEVLRYPDEAVRGVIGVIFSQFAACGSVRGTWLHLREQGLKMPLQRNGYLTAAQAERQEITWVEPTYHAPLSAGGAGGTLSPAGQDPVGVGSG
jgi:hypothetical protein